MSGHVLDDRRRALEEAFFAAQDRALIARVRAAEAARSRREALAHATGVSDPAALDALMALDLDAVGASALMLVPLVAVAWSDGAVHPRERAAVLAAAEAKGIVHGSPGRALLESWLERRPPPALFAAWEAYVAALLSTLDAPGAEALRRDVAGRAEAVASAAGGLLGGKVSSGEAAVLERVRAALGAVAA